jgi:hypothetical protein
MLGGGAADDLHLDLAFSSIKGPSRQTDIYTLVEDQPQLNDVVR